MAAVLWQLKPLFEGNAHLLRRFLIGIGIFLGSAAGLETLGNFLPSALVSVEIVLEELGEMVGVTILVWASFDLVNSHCEFVLRDRAGAFVN